MIRISRRFVLFAPAVLLMIAICALSTTTYAFMRLVNPNNNAPLKWASLPVTYTIHANGSDNLTGDASEATAIRLAFADWEEVAGSGVQFAESTAASSGNASAGLDSLNLIFFDETNATGLFAQSGIIAITPVWFDGAGNILDADIVFNGRNHVFSTDLSFGTYDVQSIAAHEIGHFLGLDHTAIYGATMLPFALKQDWRPRSLSNDEASAARAIYTGVGGPSTGTIFGRVVFAGSAAPIKGAHVVAVETTSGEAATSALTDASGDFTLQSVPNGTYYVYCEPLDGPTTPSNLQDASLTTGFATTFAGSIAAPSEIVVAGSGVELPTFELATSSGFNLSGVAYSSGLGVPTGQTTTITLSGSGLTNKVVHVLGAGIAITPNSNAVSTIEPLSGVQFSLTVDGDAQPGLRDVFVYDQYPNPTQMVALPGGIEIAAASPVVSSIAASTVSPTASTVATLSGSGFATGAVVVFGDRPGISALVANAGAEITVIPPYDANGTTMSIVVTVINPDGQQTRYSSGFTVKLDPNSQSSGASSLPSSSAADSGGGGGGGCMLRAPGARSGFGTTLTGLLLLLGAAIMRGRYEHTPTHSGRS